MLIAGGGTGGHLYPGIALAREVKRRDPDATVTFVGTATGVEAKVVPREGFPLDLIRVAGLKGQSIGALVKGLALLPLAALDAWQVISARRADVVVGVGGFASGPVLALAALRGYPTMLLEQNARPGLTNRLLSRIVRAAAVTFEDALAFFPRVGVLTGNPVRPEFFTGGKAIDDSYATPPHAARILIFGGSQGAHAINMAVVEAAPQLAAAGLAITHQTGERDMERVREGYRRAGVEARVEAFLFEMDREMTAADLVICRSGATTLSELAAAGRAAILVPLPTATDDHQRKNAEVVARSGGAVVIEQRDLTGTRLADAVLAITSDPGRRAVMASAARQLARPDAAARIADKVWELSGQVR